ncbi:MAG: DUF4381 domain-containing protein [Magnetococcales bacterium]|nr:DUF4381 domain-containing protein [Magnetococcales bacterium]
MNETTPALVLRDIHLPDPLSWWPPALGWWLLAAAIATVLATGWLIWRHVQRNRLRKAALAELDRLVAAYTSHQKPQRLAADLSSLLRRVCLSPLWNPKPSEPPHPPVAGLTGEEWLHFLDRFLPGQPFSTGVGKWLVTLPFQPPDPVCPPQKEELAALIALCRSWLHINAISRRSVG